jgi:hypothetical protein
MKWIIWAAEIASAVAVAIGNIGLVKTSIEKLLKVKKHIRRKKK